MGAIEDVRNLVQDIVAPDIKAIKVQLTALESKVDRNHNEVMAAINRVVDYASLWAAVRELQERLPKQ